MDPRTTVHRSVHEDSSEEDERLSPGAPSVDEENDSDKSSSNSKKRKRGSYRCSRCGMPKRGHNCPDNFEGVHFAIVDTPSPGVQTVPHMVGGPIPPFNLTAPGISIDDCPRETLLMHLSTLHEDNVRLVQENARLHDMLQMQAHALNSLHAVAASSSPSGGPMGPGPDFVHAGHGAMALPRPGSNLPQGMQPVGPGQMPPNAASSSRHPAALSQTPVGAPIPLFAPAFANAQAPPHLMPSSQQQQLQPTASNAPLAANRPFPAQQQQASSPSPAKVGTFPPAPSSDGAPSAKRVKIEEGSFPHSSFPAHHMMPHYPMVAGHFGQDAAIAMMDHRAGAHHFGSRPAGTGEISANGFDYDYDGHDWLDESDSSSVFYPPLDAPATLIY